MGIIKQHFDKICTNAMTRFSKLYQVRPDQVQIAIACSEAGQMSYMILVDNQGKKKIEKIKELLGVVFDFKNEGGRFEVLAAMIMTELQEAKQLELRTMSIMVELINGEIKCTLYNSDNPVETLDMEELLNDVKILANANT